MNYKYIFSLLFLALISCIFTVTTLASQSSFHWPNNGYLYGGVNYVSTSGSWSETQDQNNLGIGWTSGSWILYIPSNTPPAWSFPTGAKLLGIQLEYRIRKSSSTQRLVALVLGKKSDTVYAGHYALTSDSTCSYPEVSDLQSENDDGDVALGTSTNWQTFTSVWCNFDVGHSFNVPLEDLFTIYNPAIRVTDNTQMSYILDYARFSVIYEVEGFTASVTSSTANPNQNLAFMNIEGDIPIDFNEDTWCRIDMFERCSATDRAGWTSQTPLRRLDVYGGTDFQGQAYMSYENSTGEYSFSNIEVPFRSGFTCDYPMAVQCYQRACETYTTYNYYLDDEVQQQRCDNYDTKLYEVQGFNAGQINFNESAVASPSATINAPEDIEPDCGTDWICSIIDQTTDFLSWLFIPSNVFNNLVVMEYQEDLSTRAPFAYVYPLFFANTSDPSTDNEVPTFSFQAKLDGNWIEGEMQDNVDYAGTVFDLIKNSINFLLYAGFIVYLFLLARRLLPQ